MLQKPSCLQPSKNTSLWQARNRRFGRGSNGSGAWLDVRALEHVVAVLRDNGKPVRVEEEVVEPVDLPIEQRCYHYQQIPSCSFPERLGRTMQRQETWS